MGVDLCESIVKKLTDELEAAVVLLEENLAVSFPSPRFP